MHLPAATLKRGARLLWASLVFHLKGLAQSSFFLVIGVISPVVLATITFYLFQSGSRPSRSSMPRSGPA